MPSKYKNIVFVCTGNACRSVLAEYYFRKRINELVIIDMVVSSAGVSASPLFRVPGAIIRLLKKEGINKIDHIPTTITEKIAEEADLILAMENHQVLALRIRFPQMREKIFEFHEFSKGRKKDILDPIQQSDAFYELTCRDIKRCIEELVKKLNKSD